MTIKKQTKLQQISTLQRQKRELEAQLVGMLHFVRLGLHGARGVKGGAVIVQMHWLGGKEVCPPFAIKDGPSNETIDALIADVRRTFDEATELKP
jgi:hypothetical protein